MVGSRIASAPGLAARHGSPSSTPRHPRRGYRGEVPVNLINLDPCESFTVAARDRIAQLTSSASDGGRFSVADLLPDTAGDTGHGSTGGFGSPPAPASTNAQNITEKDHQPVSSPFHRVPAAVVWTSLRRSRRPGRANRPNGPWDATEVDLTVGRLDLGALLLTATPDSKPGSRWTRRVTPSPASSSSSASRRPRFRGFRRPRSGGLWDETRRDRRLDHRGRGTAEEVGTGRVRCRATHKLPRSLPRAAPCSPARFLGIDGPLVRPRRGLSAVPSIPTARTASSTPSAVSSSSGGGAPMAPRELLPLRLPAAPDESAGATASQRPDLNPFERGPEITEVHQWLRVGVPGLARRTLHQDRRSGPRRSVARARGRAAAPRSRRLLTGRWPPSGQVRSVSLRPQSTVLRHRRSR